MCLYCKHLKDLRKKDEKLILDSLKAWRRHVESGEDLLVQALDIIAMYYLMSSSPKVPARVYKLVADATKWIKTDVIK